MSLVSSFVFQYGVVPNTTYWRTFSWRR